MQTRVHLPPGFLQRRARDYGDPLSLTFFASCPGNGRFIQCRRSGRGAGQRTDPFGQRPTQRPQYVLHGSGDAEKKAVLYCGAKRMKTSHLPRSKSCLSRCKLICPSSEKNDAEAHYSYENQSAGNPYPVDQRHLSMAIDIHIRTHASFQGVVQT